LVCALVPLWMVITERRMMEIKVLGKKIRNKAAVNVIRIKFNNKNVKVDL